MKATRVFTFFSFVWMLFLTTATQAQCAMCKGSVQTSEYAKSINSGIEYLLAFPIILVGGVAYIWYKKRNEFKQVN